MWWDHFSCYDEILRVNDFISTLLSPLLNLKNLNLTLWWFPLAWSCFSRFQPKTDYRQHVFTARQSHNSFELWMSIRAVNELNLRLEKDDTHGLLTTLTRLIMILYHQLYSECSLGIMKWNWIFMSRTTTLKKWKNYDKHLCRAQQRDHCLFVVATSKPKHALEGEMIHFSAWVVLLFKIKWVF